MKLQGKTAIVTGGAQGFGAGIVRRFLEDGARVMVADINGDAAETLAGELGEGAIAARVDVADGASVNAMAEAALAAFGRLDILVNNAGITHLPKPMETVDEDEFDRVCAVNMKSVYLTARALVPGMRAQGSGAILNIASTAGLSPRPNLNWYNASKGWMITATRAMAVELAPEGIRVNAVAPGAINIPEAPRDAPLTQAFVEMTALGRIGTPQDVAKAVRFLASDAAAFITGEILTVSGGYRL